jgi:hypothetical protein
MDPDPIRLKSRIRIRIRVISRIGINVMRIHNTAFKYCIDHTACYKFNSLFFNFFIMGYLAGPER